MNEVSNVIQQRRSIKPESFSNQRIDDHHIEEILNNAIWAPTHGRTEPWHFYVFSEGSRAKLGTHLADAYKSITPEESFDENKYIQLVQRPFLASHVILVAMIRGTNAKIPKSEEMMACACAVQNMLLSATSLGIGSFWGTPQLLQTASFRSHFSLKEEDEFIGLVYLGHHSDTPLIPGKRSHTSKEKTTFF